jgi:hypothetical protein
LIDTLGTEAVEPLLARGRAMTTDEVLGAIARF